MYSLSTCWNSHRHIDGRAMLEEIRDLGFEYAELSHGIRISLLPGVFDAVNAGVIKISTLHNFCPLPIGVTHAAPNLYKFSSDDRRERENAYRQTLKTFDTAVRVGAKLVVLHTGCIDMKDYTDRLLEMVEKGEKETAKFEKLSTECAEKREAKKEKPQQLAIEMIPTLAEQAGLRDLMLGIENREALEEIPFETDFNLFLRQFPARVVRYWHDCGHAQIKHNLGYIDHLMHLENMADRLEGFHIHDVKFPGQDHCPPGTGTIAFDQLARLVKPNHIKVFELSPGLEVEAVKQGIAHLKAIWGSE